MARAGALRRARTFPESLYFFLFLFGFPLVGAAVVASAVSVALLADGCAGVAGSAEVAGVAGVAEVSADGSAVVAGCAGLAGVAGAAPPGVLAGGAAIAALAPSAIAAATKISLPVIHMSFPKGKRGLPACTKGGRAKLCPFTAGFTTNRGSKGICDGNSGQ